MDCNGNGQCIDGTNSFICRCNTGYTGTLCDVNINDCTGVSCSGNGRCIDGINSFVCRCNSGYTGTLCDVNIDDCTGVSCSGNGWCIDGINSFVCHCNSGYTGTLCDVNINDCRGLELAAVEMVSALMVSMLSPVTVILATLEHCVMSALMIVWESPAVNMASAMMDRIPITVYVMQVSLGNTVT